MCIQTEIALNYYLSLDKHLNQHKNKIFHLDIIIVSQTKPNQTDNKFPIDIYLH